MYSSGVYRKTNLARPEPAGYHAMRIVGWGEDETGLKEIIHFLANERYIWKKKKIK
mgnify:CR=1 FL=1